MPTSRENRPLSPFRLLTLGGLSLVDSAGTVVSRQRRRLALLCRVSCAGELGISRDSLMACLSPESPTDSARHSLHQLLYYVRQQTREDAFLGTDPLRLNPAVITSDRDDFEAAIESGDSATAVTLTRGPFLDGFHLDSVEFEEWMANERARLGAKHRGALFELATKAREAGNHVAAIEWWRQLSRLDPLEGRAALGLMRSLDAAGDTPGAVRHARLYNTLVHTELGGEGDRQVTALAAQLQAPVHDAPDRQAIPAVLITPAADATSERVRLDSTPATPEAPRPRKNQRGFVVAGILGGSLVVAIAAWVSTESKPVHSPVSSSRVVAVMPFRVMTSDSSLAQLRDGMVQLLTPRLAGDSATRLVDAATVLRAWNRERPAGGRDIDAAPMRVAAALNADGIIDGSVTGTSRHLVLTAWIQSKAEGRISLQARAEGPLDSLALLVDRLAGQLLAIGEGVEEFRLASMSNASLPAIRTYLRGLQEWRRGRAEASREHFRDALVQDSTFALAALGYTQAMLIVGGAVRDAEHARGVALANQTQLSGADRALLGVTRVHWESSAEMFRESNAAVVDYPTVPDLWYALGEAFYRNGAAAGLDSVFERARDALRRGRELDSAAAANAAVPLAVPNVAQPTLSIVELAHIRGDTAEVRRLAAGTLGSDSSSDLAGLMRWHLAAANGVAARRDFLAHLRGVSQYALTYVNMFIAFTGNSGEDMPVLLAEGERRRRTVDPGNVGYRALAVALNGGRPLQASEGPSFPSETPRGGLRSRIHEALSWGGDTATASKAELQLRPFADAPTVPGPSAEPQYYDLCSVARWRVAHGDYAAAYAASRRLRAAKVSGLAPYESGRFVRVTTLCAALLDAERATALRLPEAGERLVFADSLARDMDAHEASYHEDVADANVLLARLWERHGDLSRALRAARRRSGGMMRRPNFQTTFLREEGRLAALTGDTAGAIRAYGNYLVFRYDPEPSVRPEVERVRRELAALLRQREPIDRKIAR